MSVKTEHSLTATEKISKFASLWEERAVLYFCISNIDYLYSTCSVLETEDFIDPEHQTLYFLLNMLQKNGVSKFDLSLIINEANKLGILNSIGGADYVRTISTMDVSKENYKNILNTIIENSTQKEQNRQTSGNIPYEIIHINIK
jgi:replicative DNA helicase